MSSPYDVSQTQKYKPFNSKDGGIKIFTGDVVDNEDPEKLCRIKVSFPHLIEGAKEDLPWMYPLYPIGLGQSSKLSYFSVPEKGSKVMCIFPEGEIYFGYYVFHTRDEQSKPEIFLANYPFRYGFIDNKNYVMIDKKEDSWTMQWADVNIFINDGTITVTAAKNINLIAGENITMKAKKISGDAGSSISLKSSSFSGKFSSVKWSKG